MESTNSMQQEMDKIFNAINDMKLDEAKNMMQEMEARVQEYLEHRNIRFDDDLDVLSDVDEDDVLHIQKKS
jgi:ribosomal protein L22